MVAPFPWHALDRVSRLEMRALAAARAWAKETIDLVRLSEALDGIVHTHVEVLVRAARPRTRSKGSTDAIGVVLARQGSAPREAVLVEVEPALAAEVVLRALGRPVPAVVAKSPPSWEVAGAVAAILHAAVRRAHAGFAVEVRAAGSAALADDTIPAEAGLVAIELTVVLDTAAFAASVIVPLDLVFSNRLPGSRPDALARAGVVPVALPVVLRSIEVSGTEIAALSVGDVLVAPGLDVAHGALCAPMCERGVTVRITDDGVVVLEGEVAVLPWTASAESKMVSSNERDALHETLLDAPVVVRVEVGACEMPAREWATLARGDVVALGRKIGDPVVLRVGAVEVATGELVHVDGEIGVRILERRP